MMLLRLVFTGLPNGQAVPGRSVHYRYCCFSTLREDRWIQPCQHLFTHFHDPGIHHVDTSDAVELSEDAQTPVLRSTEPDPSGIGEQPDLEFRTHGGHFAVADLWMFRFADTCACGYGREVPEGLQARGGAVSEAEWQ